jgi:hypothetical protein
MTGSSGKYLAQLASLSLWISAARPATLAPNSHPAL